MKGVSDVSTGEHFQDKMEDDLYEKSNKPSSKYQNFLGGLALTALTLAFVFVLVMLCIALFNKVF